MRNRARERARLWRHLVWIGGLAVVLSGCAVGPNFVRPAPPSLQGYTAAKAPAEFASTTGAGSQHLHIGQQISAEWWDLLRSPALDGVVRNALVGSQTLAAARATLAAAEESVAAARGGFFPQVDVAASLERNRASALRSGSGPSGGRSGGAQTTNLYSLGPTASYSPDVFGGTRRKVEQQQALAEFQRYELGAAYLTLTGNAVTEAITIASIRAQIRATEDVIAEDEQNLSLVRQEFARRERWPGRTC